MIDILLVLQLLQLLTRISIMCNLYSIYSVFTRMFNSTRQQSFLIPNWLGKQRNIGETTISIVTALWNQVRVRVLWLSGCDSTGHTSVWLTGWWSQLFKKTPPQNVFFSKYKPWRIWPGMLWHISTFSRETSTYWNNWLKLNNKKTGCFSHL